MTSFLGKSYTYEKSENFREFLEHFGAPAERIDAVLNAKPVQKLEKDGGNYKQTTVADKTTVLNFQDGVEFDEHITDEIVAKTTITVGDDTLTQVQKFADGRVVTHKKKYSADKLVDEITASSWDGVARRFYSA